MIFEVCGDSLEACLLAKEYGAKRVELCSALSVGGLTPSYGLTKLCAAIDEVEIHVMIRQKEGGFVYSDHDIRIMEDDIRSLHEAGAKGVVFGCLTENNELDVGQNKRLLEVAQKLGLEVTFHRAFDFLNDPKEGIKQLIELGFDRILTSGLKPTAIEGIEMIRDLVNWSEGKIQIMAGSGVNSNNAQELANTGLDALHFTSHTSNLYQLGMGSETLPNQEKIKSIVALFK